MLTTAISAKTEAAGVAGAPVRHSLSPLIHNVWLENLGLDAVYLAFEPAPDRFAAFVEGLRGGILRGLNVTLPFKEQALTLADAASPAATSAGAANLLRFNADGTITADNTDGTGLLGALAVQAPGFKAAAAPIVILGAGGAARGAAAALIAAGAPEVRIVNRTEAKARAIAEALGSQVAVFDWTRTAAAFDGVSALINATSLGLEGRAPLTVSLEALPADAVVMDMVYRPLKTPLLAAAQVSGRRTVDGLEMLIQQAVPSFEMLFGRPAPVAVDVRALALAALEDSR